MKNEKRPRILVVGSFVMDQIAQTDIFPHEGQTVLGGRFSKAPGGKGANQAVQAARLGAEVTMVGKLGHDANGQEMFDACVAEGICTDHILYDPAEPSGCSVIILEKDESGQTKNRIIVLPGSNMTLTVEELSFLPDVIGSFDLVMLQLEIPMAVNEYVARLAKECSVPVMLNSAPSAPLSDPFLSCLAYISPNEHEAEDMTGVKITRRGKDVDMDSAKRAAAILHEKGVSNVLITLGDAGAVMSTPEGFRFSPSVAGVTAVDPTAAGDSFVGAFCTGLCMGWQAEETMRFANHTAAITVSRMGAMPSLPHLADVETYLVQKGEVCPDTSRLK